MTARERIAFDAGIEAARQAALVAAVSLEIRDDAGEVRQRAAVAALQGLAEGLRETCLASVACNRLQKSGKAQSIDEAR